MYKVTHFSIDHFNPQYIYKKIYKYIYMIEKRLAITNGLELRAVGLQ